MRASCRLGLINQGIHFSFQLHPIIIALKQGQALEDKHNAHSTVEAGPAAAHNAAQMASILARATESHAADATGGCICSKLSHPEASRAHRRRNLIVGAVALNTWNFCHTSSGLWPFSQPKMVWFACAFFHAWHRSGACRA